LCCTYGSAPEYLAAWRFRKKEQSVKEAQTRGSEMGLWEKHLVATWSEAHGLESGKKKKGKTKKKIGEKAKANAF